MRLGMVIGKVVLARVHESLRSARYALVEPLYLQDLTGEVPTAQQPAGTLSITQNVRPLHRGEELVVYDDLGATTGSLIAVSEGGEAAQPFLPNYKPVDAYNAAILDQVTLDRRAMADLSSPHGG